MNKICERCPAKAGCNLVRGGNACKKVASRFGFNPKPRQIDRIQAMGETCTAPREKLSETVKTEQEVVRYYSYTPTGEIQKFMMKKIKDGWKVKVCLERESEVLVVYERTVGDVL